MTKQRAGEGFRERRGEATTPRAGDYSPSPRSGTTGPARNLLQKAEASLLKRFENDAFDAQTLAFELDQLQHSVPISEGEIEDENRRALQRQRVFREAAEAVAAELARIQAVEKVMLFGSVAAPLEKEVPRFRRLRRAGIEILHECKDVDLAVWVSDFADLRALKKAAARALAEWYGSHPNGPGVAHHQVDTFLFDASNDEFRGNLCHYGECPKGKRECAVPGCGATRFVQLREGLKFRRDALAGGKVLFDRATGALSAAEDDLPF